MRYTPKTKPIPPPCGRDCPGRAPGCSAMCCSWTLYQSIREHIYQKQLAEKHAQELNLLDDCANAGLYCAVCHRRVHREDFAYKKLRSKYCPHCGAKMDGGADERTTL